MSRVRLADVKRKAAESPPSQWAGFIALWHAYNPQQAIDPAPGSQSIFVRHSLTTEP